MSDAADQQPPAATPPDELRESTEERYSKLLRTKRSEFLDHLLRSLDMVAYCHFSYLYFLDLFRFLIRSAVQLNFLTPKPPNFPVQSQRRPAIVALFGSTAFCFLCHVLSAAPSAGEQSHGYLHGGLIIDFIGQEGPTSKWRLVFMDATILALQLTMLALVVSKQDQDEAQALGELRRSTPPTQDLDSEERGEARRYSVSSESNEEDAESDGGRAVAGRRRRRRRRRRRESETLLMSGEEPVASDESERDRERRVWEITSGEFMAAELRVIDVVKKQWRKGAIRPGETGSTGAETSSEGTRRRV